MIPTRFKAQLRVRHDFWLKLVVYLVGVHGIFVVATTLLDQLGLRFGSHITDIDIDIPLLIGLGLIYLSTLLRRRKQTAWAVALIVYIFMLGFYSEQTEAAFRHHEYLTCVAKFGLPIFIIGLLALYRKSFTVKSDIRSFGYSLRFSVAILLVAFVYGTTGFYLMDKHDFHEDLTLTGAMHHTIDQFGLTTNDNFVPHTRRARLFVDSLSVVSIAAVGYAAISLFQPIRSRYNTHRDDYARARELLEEATGNSEDFFKIWPHDKLYLFDESGRSGLAYKVTRGVAHVVGDPFGHRADAKRLLGSFEDLCFGNDWLPVFVHTEPDWNGFYRRHGYSLQKIGEEAVLELDHFNSQVKGGKYFRQITNKFKREGFTTEVLTPPHSKALINRLQTISSGWLDRPGRTERQFMMGYFSEEYLQQCPVVIARDSAGTIQAFLNQIPSYDQEEANFDLLRSTSESPGNINDYLLMAFIEHLSSTDAKRLNLGLCPLAGLDELEEKSVMSRALQFLYSNGDRFYSFSGLRRFKAKYEPVWSDRYVAYKGGPRNFVRAMNTLNRALKIKLK